MWVAPERISLHHQMTNPMMSLYLLTPMRTFQCFCSPIWRFCPSCNAWRFLHPSLFLGRWRGKAQLLISAYVITSRNAQPPTPVTFGDNHISTAQGTEHYWSCFLLIYSVPQTHNLPLQRRPWPRVRPLPHWNILHVFSIFIIPCFGTPIENGRQGSAFPAC